MTIAPKTLRLMFQLPRLVYLSLAAIFIAVAVMKVGARYAFNANEGWNAFWAVAAWDGSGLYPPPESLKLNNYVPLWFYATGALGRLTGDNILAGRLLAGTALLINAGIIALIVREITGGWRGAWFAGAAFLVISGVFYGDYVAVDDPQLTANVIMTMAILVFLRRIGGTPGTYPGWLVVALLLLAGLLKHSVVAAPIAMAIFLLFYRPTAFVPFAIRCAVGLGVACAALYGLYGRALFASVLFPRPYDLAVAWSQTAEVLSSYNALVLVIAFLVGEKDAKTRFILVYAIVALVQGFGFSLGYDVDVNVFLDFAVAVAIGLGVMHESVRRAVEHGADDRRAQAVLAAWVIITVLPPVLSAEAGVEQVGRAIAAVTDNSQQNDVTYIESAQGRVLCQNLALCYWAGKDFAVDTNNLKTLILAKPELERAFIARIESCSFALIQLNDAWDSDDYDAPFSEDIVAAIEHHSAQVDETDAAYYRTPAKCDRAAVTPGPERSEGARGP